MRTLSMKEMLQFVRTNSTLHNVYSNNQLRTRIHKNLNRNNMYVLFDKDNIDGFIEWYRYPNMDVLIRDFREENLRHIHGDILYIADYIFPKGHFTRPIFEKFLHFHKKMGDIKELYIMKNKENKFFIKRIRGI